MRCHNITRTLFHHKIRAEIKILDFGVNVLLTGGERSHIGAVCVIDESGNPNTISFPDHREDILAARWANKIYQAVIAPVAVEAGIHYDNATPEQIEAILRETDSMLVEALKIIEADSTKKSHVKGVV
jgi:tagatose-1,6-bisphosphate aldolase non-catalytic subunit AgaZ/GatZ